MNLTAFPYVFALAAALYCGWQTYADLRRRSWLLAILGAIFTLGLAAHVAAFGWLAVAEG